MSEELTNYLLNSKNSRQALVKKAHDLHNQSTSNQALRGITQNHHYEEMVKINLDRVFKIAGNNLGSLSHREHSKLTPIKEKSLGTVNSILPSVASRYSIHSKGIKTFNSPLYKTLRHRTKYQIIKTAQIVSKYQSSGNIYHKIPTQTRQNFSMTQTIDKSTTNTKPKLGVSGTVTQSRLTSRHPSRQCKSVIPPNLSSSFSFTKHSLSFSPPVRKKPQISRQPSKSFLITNSGTKSKSLPTHKARSSLKPQLIYKVSRPRQQDKLQTPISRYRSFRNSRIL